MKIRDEFIGSINDGGKKREYRINDERHSSIQIGDVLLLASVSDPYRFARVEVTGINHYKSWEEALSAHWTEDFSSLFSTFDGALGECRRYYDKRKVDQYGIVVFDIRNLKAPSLKKAFVLLDTNIVIQRESYNNLSEETVQLFNWLDKLGSTKYLHPSIKDEIGKNTNEVSRKGLLIKLSAYKFLNPSNDESAFFKNVVESYPINENSIIDNKLLYEAYLNKVDFLVTDDKEMLRKATALFIKSRVLSVGEYLELAERFFPDLVGYKVLRIREEFFSECDLKSPFFDSLREDYKGDFDFDDWFKKKAKEKASAYVFRDDRDIKAFLYLKTEDIGEEKYTDISPRFQPKRRLKVGTFKNDTEGMRVGERFLKIIFDNARKRNVEEIYVTLFEGRREKVDLLCKTLKMWGFVIWGNKTNGETVLVKSMRKYDLERDVKFNFPLTKTPHDYYFIPIEPEYHTDLFPDYILSNENAALYSNGNMAHRYALEKVYVSGKSPYYVTAKPGDVAVIYRKGDRWPKRYSSVVTGTAIIEKVVSPSTVDEYLKECKNVTVFSDDELRRFFEEKKYRTVIKLLQLESFENKVIADFLQEKGIIEQNGGARTLQQMTPEQFSLIINKAKGTKQKGALK